MNTPICDDDYLFIERECAQCGNKGREIHGFVYDEDLDKHFCDETCRQDFLATRVNEDAEQE